MGHLIHGVLFPDLLLTCTFSYHKSCNIFRPQYIH